MKKQFIVGMLIATSFVSFGAHATNPSPKEIIAKQASDVQKSKEDFKKAMKDGKAKLSDLESAKALTQQKQIMDDLGLNATEQDAIKGYVAAGKGQKLDVMGTLNILLTAKNSVGNKQDAESNSIRESANASAKLMGNSNLIGLKTQSTFLGKDFGDVNQALKKLVSIAERPLTFETSERDAYTAAINKAVELSGTEDSIEAALVKGIMATAKDANGKVGVSREKAMDIIRKLLKCV